MPLYLPRKVAAQPRGSYRASNNPSIQLLTDLFDPRDLSFRQLRYGNQPTALTSQMSAQVRSFGRVAKFDTSHTGVSLGSATNYTSTTQSWLIVTDLVPGSVNGAWVFGKASSTFSNSGFWVYVLPSGQIRLAVKNAASAQSEISSTKLYSGFTVIALSVSPTSIQIAINGEVVTGSSVASFNVTNSNPISVAKSFDSYWDLFLGGVYSIAGWNGYFLAAEEAKRLSLNPWQIFAPSVSLIPVGAPAVTYTYARPTSDITTQWTPSTGTTHYTLINEPVADDNDYIVATAAGQTDEVKLASMTPPQVGTNLVINYKVMGIDGGATVTASLREGSAGTLIKTDTAKSANGTYALTVAPADWAAVSAWSDLRLRFVSA